MRKTTFGQNRPRLGRDLLNRNRKVLKLKCLLFNPLQITKKIHVKRVREQNLRFAKGYKLHPNELKGYRNIKPASFFNRNERKWASNEVKRAKYEAEIKKLNADNKKIATTTQGKITISRAAARLTLKNKPKILKDFVGESGKKSKKKK